MAGNYFQKAHLVDFFKRFRTSKLQQQTRTICKRDAEDNRRIQKVSGLWQYVGWSYYRRQIQKTMGRLFEVPATGRRSLRRAKRNVLQLLADSRKQIQDMFQNEQSIKAKLQPNQQSLSIDSVSMMEKGKIRETASDPQFNPERRAKDILSQYNRDTTFEYEQCFTGRATNNLI
ncbi:uncharacterized protein LOC118743976 [Rhagoletis pomonella]|uniref:uncharacterized protein LOC118743976 n=1 Tax=Rhagoletis pomonella TaxID=28610 RepID=UPI001780474E|nr:uncharacterized protein LOC118743976 [Rhagoletis pomonella]